MFDRVLLAVDLNVDTLEGRLVRVAVDCARTNNTSLHVMTVVPNIGSRLAGSFFPDDFEEKVVSATQARLHEFTRQLPADLQLQHIVAEGTIYAQILAVAKEIDAGIIFVGSHRPELGDYLIGPNAARIVRHAECSVMVVR